MKEANRSILPMIKIVLYCNLWNFREKTEMSGISLNHMFWSQKWWNWDAKDRTPRNFLPRIQHKAIRFLPRSNCVWERRSLKIEEEWLSHGFEQQTRRNSQGRDAVFLEIKSHLKITSSDTYFPLANSTFPFFRIMHSSNNSMQSFVRKF